MRIAYLSIGRHVHTERWIRWFADRGHECHLLTVQPGPIVGVQVHDIHRGGLGKPIRYWRSLGVVRDALRRIRPDLLNTHFLTGYGYWGHFSGFHPNVLTVWGDDVYVTPHQNPLKGWLARRALRNADAITGDSLDILRACVRLGADARRCFEIVWGVDFDQFHPGRGSELRTRLSIPESAPLLFSPRSFTQPYYNIDIIIEAFAAVSRLRPQAHFLFSGYEGDQTPFVDRARQAGLAERTHFVGRIPHEQFGDYLAAADVFVSVPSVDATAVSLLEAMACACCVVVSDLPSPLEWIEDGISGRVAPPRNVERLTQILLELVDDPKQRQRLGQEAYRHARARAGFDDNMERAAAIYESVVAGTLPETGYLDSGWPSRTRQV